MMTLYVSRTVCSKNPTDHAYSVDGWLWFGYEIFFTTFTWLFNENRHKPYFNLFSTFIFSSSFIARN